MCTIAACQRGKLYAVHKLLLMHQLHHKAVHLPYREEESGIDAVIGLVSSATWLWEMRCFNYMCIYVAGGLCPYGVDSGMDLPGEGC